VVCIDGFGWLWGLTSDFAFVFEGSEHRFLSRTGFMPEYHRLYPRGQLVPMKEIFDVPQTL
jgi:hypothetical protein